jgi:carbamoyl-phosphate synthase small subunit
MKGRLVLETGEAFEGELLGSRARSIVGEVVFTTAMTGYQEMLTDPSYCEQIVVATYPHIGNVGINQIDMECRRVQVAGLVVASACAAPSSWRSQHSLAHWFDDAEVPFLSGVATRTLTLRLRERGVVRGWMGPATTPLERVKEELESSPHMKGRNLVSVVSTKKPYAWSEGTVSIFGEPTKNTSKKNARHIAVLDFGLKHSILRQLVDQNLHLTVFPAATSPKEILSSDPHGIFLTNGPGDPAACGEIIENVRALLGVRPLFGICMGHQILAHALGGKTYKLPFGHRGINHPVRHVVTGKVEITSHNHGFSVEARSLPSVARCTHLSLNDETVEGLECAEKKAFSVQYHPEANPGPHDSSYLFQKFAEMVNT